MSVSPRATLGALFLTAACSADGPSVGVAEQAYCRGFYVNHVAARDGTAVFISPDYLAQATEAWGPQTLSLNVERDFAPQVSYQESPSASRERDKVTRSLQASLSFSLTTEVDLSANTAVLVPTDAYYRLEAYPEYQVVDFDVRQDPCGPMGDVLLTTGSVYRPIGIYFRILVYVGGEWNALTPPSPWQIPLPTSSADAGAPSSNGGGDAGRP